MRAPFRAICLLVTLGAIGVALAFPTGVRGQDASPPVRLVNTPDGGIQPQAAVDAEGTVHLLYFKGDPAAGDLFYVRRPNGHDEFTPPIRVNSQPGSAVAVGTIRGGQIALGKHGRVHVVWNGSQRAKPGNPAGGAPLLYARADLDGSRFEPQRNLMRRTTALDGGGTVAADPDGHVYAVWHGRGERDPIEEAWRAVWIARSTDDGATFAPEERALDHPTGACSCCGTRAFVDRHGTLLMLYRAATAGVNRDMTLIQSRDQGAHFQNLVLDPWRVSICPMSSEALADTADGDEVLAAWETNGQVYHARIGTRSMALSPPVAPPGEPKGRKHPALAVGSAGEVILVWTEGTGWRKGGALVWQVFDRSGRPQGKQGRLEAGIPIWGLASVVRDPTGGFLIIH